MEPEAARLKFGLPADGRDWTIAAAQADIASHSFAQRFVTPLLYRPFDVRYTFWTGRTKGFLAYPRREVMQHLVEWENLALMFNRQIAGTSVSQFGVTSYPACHGTFYLGNRGQDYVAPLYVIDDPTDGQLGQAEGSEARSNISDAILEQAAEGLNLRVVENAIDQADAMNSRDLFNYIYAVFNSPRYRELYSSQLRLDFPRVPFTSDADLFRGLRKLGLATRDASPHGSRRSCARRAL